jgi:alpha-glucuronidase
LVSDMPKLDMRLWNLWDNFDESVERGYSGKSIFNWKALPGTVDTRYTDYARLLASTGY